MPPTGGKRRKLLDVMLQLRLSKESGRDILGGITSAVRRKKLLWRLHVVNFEYGPGEEATERLLARDMDGAIVQRFTDRVRAALEKYDGPLVSISRADYSGEGRREHPPALVHPDDREIGRRGARYLASLGRFRSFGFAGSSRFCERYEGFREGLARRGAAEVREFDPVGPAESAEFLEALGAWLRELPRPAAVMAANDEIALSVLDVAARSRIRVPRDMAVLGVDNDEMLCESSDPPLASVKVDHGRLGELAVEALRRRIAHPNDAPFRLAAPVVGIAERGSARPIAPGSALAERAAAFIRRNATGGIGAADVAAHLGVSRTLADLRFREVHGESPLSMILRVRLETLARKLRESDAPCGELALACGFGDADHARRLFRRRFGVSMRQWRARH